MRMHWGVISRRETPNRRIFTSENTTPEGSIPGFLEASPYKASTYTILYYIT